MFVVSRQSGYRIFALAVSLWLASDVAGVAQPSAAVRQENGSRAATASTPNFYFVASEQLANRIVQRDQTETGPVVDMVLGAQIRGERITHTEVFIDFQPDAREAHFNFCLTGVTQSDTVGTTPQALTRTLSCHSFGLSKPVYFDGKGCRTYKPRGWVKPRNQTAGVRTPVSGVPLIGPAVDRFTFSEVEKRRPLGERIAAEKVLGGASPKFNESIDESLGKLNSQLSSTVQPFLTKWRLQPDEQYATSTDTRLTFQGVVRSGGAPNVSPMPGDVDSDSGLAVAIHESLLNAWIDRMQLGGKSMTDRQIDTWVEELTGKTKADAKPAKPSLATIRLDDADPIRFRFADDQLILIVRAGLKPIVGGEIPTQTISIPMQIAAKDGKIVLTPGKVSISGEGDSGTTLTIVRKMIRQQITTRLESREFSGTLPIPAGEGKQVTLTAHDLRARDGWFVLKLE